MVFQAAPVVFTQVAAVEVGHLWRTIGYVIGIPISSTYQVVGATPSDVFTSYDVPLVKCTVILCIEDVSKLIHIVQARIRKPKLLIALAQTRETLATVVASSLRPLQLCFRGD